jgi:hypothetical protein
VKITTHPVISDQIFLADLSPAFAAAELKENPDVETRPELRAWVKVKQATTADHKRRAELYRDREQRWNDGGDGRVTSISLIYHDNPVVRRMIEAEMTLAETGNMEDEDGKPVFDLPIKKAADFEARWLSLDSMYTDAIYVAILTVNPDWLRSGE